MAKREELQLDVTVKGADDVDKLASSLDELDGKSATVGLSADDKASANVREAIDKGEEFDRAAYDATLEVDDKASDDIRDATRKGETFDKQTFTAKIDTTGAKEIVGSFDSIGAAAGKLVSPAGAIGLIGGGLLKAAGDAADLATEVGSFAQLMGDSTEEASRFLAVMDKVNLDFNDVLEIASEVSSKLRENPEIAAQIGVSLDDLRQRPLQALIDAIDGVANAQVSAGEKLGLMVEVFGEEGSKQLGRLLGLLGPNGLRGEMDEIADSRLISEEDVRQAQLLKEEMNEFKSALQGAALEVGQTMIPAIRGIAIAIEELPVPDLFPGDTGDFWAAGGNAIDEYLGRVAESDEVFQALRGAIDSGGLSAQEFNRIAADGTVTMEELDGALATTGASVEELAQQQLDAAKAGEFAARSLEEINSALNKQDAATGGIESMWRRITADMVENGHVTEINTHLYNELQNKLHLSNEEMDALANQKANEAMEANAAAAKRFAEAMRDVQVAIRDINVDDLDNMASALAGVLDVADRPLDFEILKGSLTAAIGEMQDLVDEKGSLDWNTALAGVRDQFQEGLALAFQVGGRTGAETFSAEFLQAISEQTGLSMTEVYEMVGIPGGDVEARLRLVGTEESKADAERILGGLAGVDPNNPIIAYIQAALQTGGVDPVIAEIAALLLAAKMGVPVAPELMAFTPEQIASAETVLAQAGMTATVGVEADPVPAQTTIGTVTDAEYQATIDAQAETAQAGEDLLDEASRHRPAPLVAIATNTNSASDDLDAVANPSEDGRVAGIFAQPNNVLNAAAVLNGLAISRNAPIFVLLPNASDAERRLNEIARDRNSTIFVNTVSTGGGGGGGGGGSAGTLAAPLAAPVGPSVMATGPTATLTAAPVLSGSSHTAVIPPGATVTNNLSVTVQAAVIGNPHEVERAVAKALRGHVRLNGSRNN